MIGYVTIKKQGGELFSMVSILGVPTGETRQREDGKIEAEFICIRRSDNCEKVWAIRSQII